MLEDLVGSDEHSDVTLLVRDGEVVPAHQLLLATRCPTLCSVTGICLWLFFFSGMPGRRHHRSLVASLLIWSVTQSSKPNQRTDDATF